MAGQYGNAARTRIRDKNVRNWPHLKYGAFAMVLSAEQYKLWLLWGAYMVQR